jgi:hypothetical protein
VLLIERGPGRAFVGGRCVDVAPGSTVYVPPNVWHGVENGEEGMELVWIVTPPGLEHFFRSVGSAPGTPPPALSPDEVARLGRLHGTVFAPPGPACGR